MEAAANASPTQSAVSTRDHGASSRLRRGTLSLVSRRIQACQKRREHHHSAAASRTALHTATSNTCPLTHRKSLAWVCAHLWSESCCAAHAKRVTNLRSRKRPGGHEGCGQCLSCQAMSRRREEPDWLCVRIGPPRQRAERSRNPPCERARDAGLTLSPLALTARLISPLNDDNCFNRSRSNSHPPLSATARPMVCQV